MSEKWMDFHIDSVDSLMGEDVKLTLDLNTIGLGVVLIVDEEIYFINDKLSDILGYNKRDLLGRNFFDFVAEDYRQKLKDRYKRRLEGKKVFPRVRFFFSKKDGKYLKVEAYFGTVIIRSSKEKKIGALGLIYDLSEVVELEKSIASYEENLKIITETVDAGIMLLDATGTIIYANRYSKMFFNLVGVESIGRNFSSFVQEEYRYMIQEKINQSYYEDKSFSGEITVSRGSKIGYIKVNVKPIDIQGIRFTLLTFQDNTDQVLYRMKLENENKKQKELYFDTIRALAEAVDAKDRYTRGHSSRVAFYSKLIAKELGFSEKHIELIEIAGLLHDIGKIGIKDHILNKPGKLSLVEFDEMKKHPEIGAKIVSKIQELIPIVPGILYHHERIDGSGYPQGLKGEDIPIEARIIAVADAFDAMTSNRPYREAMEIDMAVDELKRYAGTKFCKYVVDAFIRILDRERSILEDIEKAI